MPTQPGVTKPAGTQPSTQPATGFNLSKPAGQTTTQPAAAGGFGLSTQPTVTLGGLAKPTQPSGTQPTSTTTGMKWTQKSCIFTTFFFLWANRNNRNNVLGELKALFRTSPCIKFNLIVQYTSYISHKK